MNELITKLGDFGALGILCGLLIYNVVFLQRKVISIVENNTQAMTSMKTIIEECHKKGERNE